MRSTSKTLRVRVLFASMCAAVLWAAVGAYAADQIPTWKSAVFPCYMPKCGQADTGARGGWMPVDPYPGSDPGNLRDIFGNFYEQWWREYSYYQTNPTNGARLRGWWMASKTYGDTMLPWSMGIAGGVTTNINAVVMQAYPGVSTYRGTLSPLPSKTMGVSFNIAGAVVADAAGTGGLSGDGTGTINYDTGEYVFTLNTPPATQVDVTTTYLAMAVQGMQSPADWPNYTPDIPKRSRGAPDGRGGRNWEVPPRPGIPPQLYGGTGPLLDGYWTPGERFTDTARQKKQPNGQWDPAVPDEDRWSCDNNNPRLPTNGYTFVQTDADPKFLTKTAGGWDRYRGEYFAAYEFGSCAREVNGRVTSIAVHTNHTIYIAGPNGTNLYVSIDDMDLSPPLDPTEPATNNYPVYEGDFNHTAITGHPGTAVDIPINWKFDYNVRYATATPIVYPAYANGLDDNGTGRVYVTFMSYLRTPQVLLPIPQKPDYCQNPAHYDGSELYSKVYVPVYQAGELWGIPFQTNNATFNTYMDAPDANGYTYRDNVWTPGAPEEPYEDYIAWWSPFLGMPVGRYIPPGAWVSGVVGLPSPHAGGNDPFTSISWADYQAYVDANYPGNRPALIARAGNDTYDGPDNWEHLGDAADQHMQWGGYDTQVTLWPLGWEWYGGMGYGTSLSGFWNYMFSTYSGGATPDWAGMPAHVWPWTPLAQSNSSVVVTTYVGAVEMVATNFSDVQYPPAGSTWGYNGPREFKDMASSMYHAHGDIRASIGRSFGQGGDMRLGEITSPKNTEIWGQDINTHIGFPKPYDMPAPALKPNDIIPAAGPGAYRMHGTWGTDAGDVMDVELLTWRIDGTANTGPRSVHRAVANASPMYGGDHHDVDLDGLVDQGETIPFNSVNWMVDPDPNTTDDGMATMYPFHWQRFLEDVVQVWDDVEDWPELYRRNTNSMADVRIVAPGGYTWPDGAVMSSPTYFNTGGRFVCYKQELPSHTGFEVNTDDVWIEYDGNNTYNADLLYTNVSGLVSNGFAGTSLSGSILYYDANGNGSYDVGENVWLDAGDGLFTSDWVLSDQYGLLRPGAAGVQMQSMPPTNNVRVCYQDVNANGPDTNDNYWIENRFVPTTRTNVYDVSGTSQIDIAFFCGTPALLTNGTPASAPVPLTAVYYIARNHTDTGWMPGDDVWVDRAALGLDGLFTAPDKPIAAPNGLLNFALGPGSIFPDSVAYNDYNVSGNYEYGYDDVWADYDGNGNYDIEQIILLNGSLNNGDAGTAFTGNIAWIDLPGADGNLDGVFTPLTPHETINGEGGLIYYGDALFVDGNNNGQYDEANQRSIPIYWVGLYNGAGASAPAVFKAGNVFGCTTRDGMRVSGFMQVQPILRLGVLTHEQCHDVLGWPDLYDYDRYGGTGVYNMPIGATDLMADGFLVHGWPLLKPVMFQNLKTIIGTPNSGIHTVKMYPIEHIPDQYFYFGASGRSEAFIFHYQSGASIYSSPLSRGLQISHTDGGTSYGGPIPVQRSNMRFSGGHVVQADGLFEMEDGVSGGGAEDSWPGTLDKRVFSETTVPPARWWDQLTSGIRIVDIREPADTNSWDAVEVDFEWIGTSGEWFWTAGGSDMDLDGIPDAWEINWFSKYWGSDNETTNHVDQTTDWDADGLPDYAEWLARLNPTKSVSWTLDPYNTDPRNDSQYDLDNDQLSNIQEYNLGTNMREPDTDDDGLSDKDELDPAIVKFGGKRFTDPSNSRDPLINRSLVMSNGGGFVIPNGIIPTGFDRFANSNWSVESWVNLSANNQTGVLVGRNTSPGVTNYALGVIDNVPAICFASQGYRIMAGGTTSVYSRLPTNVWIHLAGTWDQSRHELKLYVNGTNVQTVLSFVDPVYTVQSPLIPTGGFTNFTTFINQRLTGYMDDVRIWKSARTESQIRENKSRMVDEVGTSTNGGHYVLSGIGSAYAPIRNNPDLVAYYMFDDSWNTSIVNRLTGLVMSYGSEDFHRTLEWDYAIRNQPLVLTTNTYANIGGKDTYFIAGGGADAYNDPDHDGLDNLYEYLADVNPAIWDSWNNGLLDYDKFPLNSWSNSDKRVTFGQTYDDMDRIPDGWETMYSSNSMLTGKMGPDPRVFDAYNDPDEDGWSNFTEFMGYTVSNEVTAAGTTNVWLIRNCDPLLWDSHPLPMMHVKIRYNGVLIDMGDQNAWSVEFFNRPSMDKIPSAKLTIDNGIGAIWTRDMTTGFIKEGTNYIFGYADVNGNEEWDGPATEPAGICPTPINVGWDEANDIEVNINDGIPGYHRYWWPPIGLGGAQQYMIKVSRGSTLLFTKIITGRNYIHEGDYLDVGRYGLGVDAANAYSFMVFTNQSMMGVENWVPYAGLPIEVMLLTNDISAATTVLTPSDTVLQYGRNRIKWTMDKKATFFVMDVANMAGTVLASVTNIPPFRDPTDSYEFYMPFFAGNVLNAAGGTTWTNGRYQVRVTAGTPTRSLASSWTPFVLDVKGPEQGGASAISGTINYYGKVRRNYSGTNLTLIVQAYSSRGFSGAPDAQIQVPYGSIENTSTGLRAVYDIGGLHPNKYYMRAFFDQNGNGNLDSFESWGISGDLLVDAWPTTVDLSNPTPMRAAGVNTVIRDVDTDSDRLPDGWEYQFYGTIVNGGYYVAANGLTLLRCFQIGDTGLSPLVADNDSDGLSDMYEITYSHTNDYSRFNPYNSAWSPTGTDLNPFSADTDGDGVLDAADTVPTGGGSWSIDSDGDGMMDAEEIKAGTNPNDANDYLKVTYVMPTATQQFSMTWTGKAGVTYVVQYRDSLLSGSWATAPGSSTFVGVGPHTYTDPTLPVPVNRYYRLTVP